MSEPEYVIVQPGLDGVAWLGEIIDGEPSPIGKIAALLAAHPVASPAGQDEEAASEEEFGVRLNGGEVVRSTGTGPWGRIHAEQEAKRVNHLATLPFVGQPKSGEVVTRTVTRYEHWTEWTPVRPAPAVDEEA